GIITTQTAVVRHQCYCARTWDQTPLRARRSKHHWGHDLRLPLPCPISYATSGTVLDPIPAMESSLLLLPGRRSVGILLCEEGNTLSESWSYARWSLLPVA